MLTPFDMLEMRREAQRAQLPYRETTVYIPTLSSGSNWEAFSDAAYDITGQSQTIATFTVYRLYARVKIVRDTTLMGISQVVPGIETGDYLLYFNDKDRAVLDTLIANKDAYLKIDGIVMRPYNDTLNGVAQTFDIFVHAKKYSPRYKAIGS